MADQGLKVSDSLYEVMFGLTLMQWRFIPLKLSDGPKDFKIEEALFEVDSDKIVYVCIIDKLGSGNIAEILEKRKQDIINETKEFICSALEIEECEFFSLYVVKDAAQKWTKILPKPKLSSNNIGTYFLYDELICITQADKYDRLLLWKFAKAYTELMGICDIQTERGNLDVFAWYKQNHHSLKKSDTEQPDVMIFKSSFSKDYIKRLKDDRNEHEVDFPFRNNHKKVTVFNYFEHAPIYRQVGDVYRGPILLEDFIIPIWFTNDQYDTLPPPLINPQLEMFAFWLLVLNDHLRENFVIDGNSKTLIVKVIIGDGFKPELRPRDIPNEIPLNEIKIPIVKDGSEVSITIPIELAVWYSKSDNQGERWAAFNLLKSILKAKSGDTDQQLWKIISEQIPIGPAKMASMLGNANNIQLETRALPQYRKLQQHDLSEIQYNLTRSFGIQVEPDDFASKDKKNKLCVKIAGVLHDHLIKELKAYDGMKLLPQLIAYNEACTQEKAIKKLDRPARIALFGADPVFLTKEFFDEQERTKTGLAIRCLIELIVAYNMVDGTKTPNDEDGDYLIALMYEMISWANLADGIHHGVYDPPMKLLKCGRIDVDYSSINSKMYSFGFTRTEIELDQYDQGYDDLFKAPSIDNIDVNSPDIKEVENAFSREWGISFLRLNDFINDLINLPRLYTVSVFATDEKLLYEELKKTKFNWTDSEINSTLNALTLIQGWKISHPPTGYRPKDTKPWHYNRALSFLRRPIAKLIKDERIFYIWGYRHLDAAFENMTVLLLDGILWNPGDGPLTKLNSKFADKKGDEFRFRVHAWLKSNSDFEIRGEEIDMKPKAKLDPGKDLGDIDIFAIDHSKKIIFSLECKNTSESKSVHDFKTDLEQYSESKGKRYIEKHLNRHNWLKENKSKLEVYVKDSESYEIVSVIVTAFEVPFTYMEQSQLPMISYPRLKLEGVRALQNLIIK